VWGVNALIPDWQYSNPTLTEQLNAGVRNFELDLHFDAEGRVLVYHVPAVDSETVCICLASCLAEIRTWSDAHPSHLPITVLLEIKCCGFFDNFHTYWNGGIQQHEFDEVDNTIWDAWKGAQDKL
jgi:hypothetical protein